MHDESSGLAALLREAPVPPSRLTPQEVLRQGRRSVRRRRGLAMGGAAAAVVVLAGLINVGLGDAHPPTVVVTPTPTPTQSPTPEPAPSWVATRLAGVPGENRTQAVAVDSSGRYVAGMAGGKIVLWDNGSPSVLPQPEADLMESDVRDVNSSGTVVGSARRHDGRGFAWIYRDGTVTKLAAPQGVRWYQATNVNDRGDVIGGSERREALLWPAAEPGRVRVLPTVEVAHAIGEDGTIGSTIGDGDRPCVMRADRTIRELPGGPHDPGGKVFALQGEWAAGWVSNPDNGSNLMAARWNLRTGELTYYAELTRPAEAVSATGAILSGQGGIHAAQPVFVAPDGTRHPLQGTKPLPTRDPREGVAAVDINADGSVIVGEETDRSGTYALVWRWSK